MEGRAIEMTKDQFSYLCEKCVQDGDTPKDFECWHCHNSGVCPEYHNDSCSTNWPKCNEGVH